MSTLDELKRKYSGGTIPDWELKPKTDVKSEEPPKRGKIKLPKTEEQPVSDGDSD